jgi:ABC-type branched-subunit amino acid transport system substrate-binding protein
MGTHARGIVLAAVLAALAAPAEPARAQERTLLVGQTIALTGGPAEHGKAVLAGASLYFEKVNASGGVAGRRIVLKTLDDGGDGGRAAENTARLAAEDKVLAVFGGIEGGPCVASMKVAAEKRVPLVACLAGSPELRDPFQRYAFPVRAAHLNEFARLIDTALTYGRGRIAFLYSDSDTGRQHLANVRKLLAARQLELALGVPLAGQFDPAKIAAALKQAGVQAMFNHGSYAQYAAIMREAKKLGLDIQFLAVNSGAQQMVRLLGQDATGLIFTQVVPYPWRSTPAVVKEFHDELKARAPGTEVSFSALEGFISAKVLVEALRRAARPGRAPERETLVAALESMQAYDVGGLVVSFTPAAHTGADFVDTVIVARDGRFAR